MYLHLNKILYVVFNLFGIISLLFSIIIINRKHKVVSNEYLSYYYMFFMIGFFVFAKIFHIILDFDYKFNIINHSTFELIKFLSSGYTFIGGIIGGFAAIFLLAKMAKNNYYDILLLFAPSVLLMYAFMKIGCYFNGCCGGINGFSIQLLESFLNLSGYILIMVYLNDEKRRIYASGFVFGLFRFVVSFFRKYPNNFSFIFIQVFCFLLIICCLYGLIISKKKEKLCKKG